MAAAKEARVAAAASPVRATASPMRAAASPVRSPGVKYWGGVRIMDFRQQQPKATILVTLDNVICDVDAEVVRRFSLSYPGQTALTTTSATRRHREIADDLDTPYRGHVKAMQRASGVGDAQPVPGAIAALKDMLAEGYDVQLCLTSAAPEGIHGLAATLEVELQWVRRHLGTEWTKRVILTSDLCRLRGQVLLTDRHDFPASQTSAEWAHVIFRRPFHDHLANELQGRPMLHSWAAWRETIEGVLAPRDLPQSAASPKPSVGSSGAKPSPTPFVAAAAVAAAVEALQHSTTDDSTPGEASSSWSARTWMDALRPESLLADALCAPLTAALEGSLVDATDEAAAAAQLAYIRHLGQHGDADAIEGLISSAMAQLARSLHVAAAQLAQAPATVDEFNDKFLVHAQLQFGDLADFYAGLEGVIGMPSPNLREVSRSEDRMHPRGGLSATAAKRSPLAHCCHRPAPPAPPERRRFSASTSRAPTLRTRSRRATTGCARARRSSTTSLSTRTKADACSIFPTARTRGSRAWP